MSDAHEEHREHDDDPEKLADELEGDADRLQKKSEDLGDEISETRRDWEAKRRDPGVPGADPPFGEDGDEAA
jgi:hypothetical protein